jgi:hypothetical protein
VPELRRTWAEHEARWPLPRRSEASPPPDNPDSQDSLDAPGAWRGDGGRRLTPDANAEVDRGCERIREVGENVIVPAVSGIEAEDPDRQLVGFEYRFKGADRIKEKVADQLRFTPGLSPSQALSVIPDAVRFTFQYPESSYAAGVQADIQRLQDAGFMKLELRNTWTSEQYMGINGRWLEPQSGQMFEVQFHTRASFEGKQLTHDAYERLRSPVTTEAERDELREFQRQVCVKIRVPPDTAEIDDYRPEQRDG